MALFPLANLTYVLAALVNNYDHPQSYEPEEEGGNDLFLIRRNDNVIFKNTSEGILVLWTSLDPSLVNSTLPDDLRKRLQVQSQPYGEYHLHIENFTESDAGLYGVGSWLNYSGWDLDRTYELTVCRVEHSVALIYSDYSGSAELRCEGAGDNLTVRWFRGMTRDLRWGPEIGLDGWYRIFSETGSLNPFMEDLEGRVRATEDGSSLRISNLTSRDFTYYSCVVLDGERCVGSRMMSVRIVYEYVYRTVGGEAVLPCFGSESGGQAQAWYVPYPPPYHFVKPSKHQSEGSGNGTNRRQQQMYVADRRETGNNSLVIPSLMLNHSGSYRCFSNMYRWITMFVCLEPAAPPTEFFTDGGEVVLSCDCDLDEDDQVVWFRRTARHHGDIEESSHVRENSGGTG